jgi:uncharacterized protein
MATFVISKRLDDSYKFEFVSRKGKTIFTSVNFELRFECENEIEYLKENLEAVFFMKFKSTRGKFYFKIILNEKEIATSRKYSTQLLLQKAESEILRSLFNAEILDFSSSDSIFSDI